MQALFESPQEDLSDTQFALIYGVSRDRFQNLSGRRRHGGSASGGSRGGVRLYALNDEGELEVKRRLVHSFSAMDSSSAAPFYGSSLSTLHDNDKDTTGVACAGGDGDDTEKYDTAFLSASY